MKLWVWGLVVLAGAAWEGACGYKAYDLRRSTDSCVRLKDEEACLPPQPWWCLSPGMISTAAPRWLGAVAGLGGPLITWVPLFLARRTAATTVLKPVLLWYLSFIGAVRHSRSWVPLGWDPSGHVFVYGAQLVPLWLTGPQSRGGPPGDAAPAAEWLLALWSSALWYLSGSTAAFFHTLSESFAGWLLVATLHLHLLRREELPRGGSHASPARDAAPPPRLVVSGSTRQSKPVAVAAHRAAARGLLRVRGG